MEKDQALKELEPLLGVLFSLEGIHSMNYKVDGLAGHPFTIGSEHVAYASDHNNGRLDDKIVDGIGCAHQDKRGGPKCRRPYASHTSDTVLFLKLKGHALEAKVKEVLSNAQVLNTMAQAKIDGFIFVETPEKFRIHKEVLPS